MPEVKTSSNPHLKVRPVLIGWAVIVVLFTAAVFFMIGYNYGQDNPSIVATETTGSVEVPPVPAAPSDTATADVTANWKTYTNTKHNVSIKYPTGWTATEKSVKETAESTSATDFVEFTQDGKTFQVEGTDVAPVTVSFKPANGKTGYETAISNKTNSDNETVSKITVGGAEAGKLVNYLSTTVYIVKSDELTSISLVNSGDEAVNAPFIQIYSAMLDSFQFTK